MMIRYHTADGFFLVAPTHPSPTAQLLPALLNGSASWPRVCCSSTSLLSPSSDRRLAHARFAWGHPRRDGDPSSTIAVDSSLQESLPCLRLPDGRSVSGDLAIARYVARSSGATAAAALLGGADPVEASVVDQWLDLSQTRDLVELAGTLDAHLAPR